MKIKKYTIALAIVFAAAAITLAIAGGTHSSRPSNPALKKVNQYWTGNFINLDEYLQGKGFEPVSTDPDAYVYEKDSKIVSIQDFGDYVRIGDGNGTSQQHGVNGEAYECRLARYEQSEDGEPVLDVFDIGMTLEAVEDVVYWAGE